MLVRQKKSPYFEHPDKLWSFFVGDFGVVLGNLDWQRLATLRYEEITDLATSDPKPGIGADNWQIFKALITEASPRYRPCLLGKCTLYVMVRKVQCPQ